MVKLLEEVEEDRSESTSRRMSLDTSPPHTPSPRPSTSSSHYYPQNLLSSPPPSHLSPLQPGSPDSSSSISSAHTFHGFSAKPSPLPTPTHPPEPHQSPFSAAISPNPSPSPPPLRPMISKKAPVFNRLVRDEPPASVALTESVAVTGFADAGGTTDYESGMDGSVGGEERGEGSGRRGISPLSSLITRRATTVIAVRKAALVLRWLEFAVCLVSFSVMTADRNRGWALDSFDRYKEFSWRLWFWCEFRYSMSVNVIGFAYSGLQGCCLAHRLRKGKHITQSYTMLAYLLMSASSSAATRVDDWITNWGNDKFTTMAGASVAMSFIAFGAFALSSMISGFLLCTRRST
ncbi:hypothetical protein V2J09_003794 [Rumex salicifolius]